MESSRRRTKINVLEEGQIQGSANGIRLALVEHHMPAIVALLDRLEDVDRVVLALSKAGNIARLRPLGRDREQLAGVFGADREVGPLGCHATGEDILGRRRRSKDGRRFKQRYCEVRGNAHLSGCPRRRDRGCRRREGCRGSW